MHRLTLWLLAMGIMPLASWVDGSLCSSIGPKKTQCTINVYSCMNNNARNSGFGGTPGFAFVIEPRGVQYSPSQVQALCNGELSGMIYYGAHELGLAGQQRIKDYFNAINSPMTTVSDQASLRAYCGKGCEGIGKMTVTPVYLWGDAQAAHDLRQAQVGSITQDGNFNPTSLHKIAGLFGTGQL